MKKGKLARMNHHFFHNTLRRVFHSNDFTKMLEKFKQNPARKDAIMSFHGNGVTEYLRINMASAQLLIQDEINQYSLAEKIAYSVIGDLQDESIFEIKSLAISVGIISYEGWYDRKSTASIDSNDSSSIRRCVELVATKKLA